MKTLLIKVQNFIVGSNSLTFGGYVKTQDSLWELQRSQFQIVETTLICIVLYIVYGGRHQWVKPVDLESIHHTIIQSSSWDGTPGNWSSPSYCTFVGMGPGNWSFLCYCTSVIQLGWDLVLRLPWINAHLYEDVFRHLSSFCQKICW